MATGPHTPEMVAYSGNQLSKWRAQGSPKCPVCAWQASKWPASCAPRHKKTENVHVSFVWAEPKCKGNESTTHGSIHYNKNFRKEKLFGSAFRCRREVVSSDPEGKTTTPWTIKRSSTAGRGFCHVQGQLTYFTHGLVVGRLLDVSINTG